MELNIIHYQRIADCFPRQRGNVSMDNLSVLNAILFVAENGCKWRKLPAKYGNWHTVYSYFVRSTSIHECPVGLNPVFLIEFLQNYNNDKYLRLSLMFFH